MISTTDTQPDKFEGKVRIDVRMVNSLSEQQTGKNKSPVVLGNGNNGGQQSSEEKPETSYNIDIIV